MRLVLLDRLVAMEPGRQARATVRFDPALAIFADHFPGRPVVPGTLLTEAMAQTAGWLIAASIDFAAWPLLALIDRARFIRPVQPGVELTLDVVLRSARSDGWDAAARVDEGGQTVADARLVFHRAEFGDNAAAGQWIRSTFAALGGPAALLAAMERRS